MKKRKLKFRNRSMRSPNWDYSMPAGYFITICTKHRLRFFGQVRNQKMILSELGEIAAAQWLNTQKIRPDMNITLGSFVVMPDHFHALITIGDNRFNLEAGKGCYGCRHCNGKQPCHGGQDCHGGQGNVGSQGIQGSQGGVAMHYDPTVATDISDTPSSWFGSMQSGKFGPQSKNLGSIIRGFKASVTTAARKKGRTDFAWQSLYHDRILKDGQEYRRVNQYIQDNPRNWVG